jgi:hypothetical protein
MSDAEESSRTYPTNQLLIMKLLRLFMPFQISLLGCFITVVAIAFLAVEKRVSGAVANVV